MFLLLKPTEGSNTSFKKLKKKKKHPQLLTPITNLKFLQSLVNFIKNTGDTLLITGIAITEKGKWRWLYKPIINIVSFKNPKRILIVNIETQV